MPHTPGSDTGEVHDPLIADPVELDHAARQSLLHDAARDRQHAEEGSFDRQGENYAKAAEAELDALQ